MQSESPRDAITGRPPGDSFDLAEAELAGLAEQLRTEADHLARVYPADTRSLDNRRQPMLSRHHAARSSARWIAWVSACALLALVGVGVGVLVHIPKSGNGPLASPTRPTEKSPIPGPLLAGSQQEASAVESRSRLAAPVMFVSELSDPELEAWLDLRQEGVEEQIAF